MQTWPVLGLIACTAAWAQEPPAGFQRSAAQQRYVDVQLSRATPVVRVWAQGQALGAPEARTATVFGSLGYSAAWSVEALMYQPQLWVRQVGTSRGIRIQFGVPDGLFVNKGDGEDLGGAGEKVGLMLYGAFRLAVAPGEYEIYEALNWRGGIGDTSATSREKFKPIRFRVDAGVPVYLGRLAFVPRVVPLPPAVLRAQGEGSILPTHKIDGFQIWIREALESDRQMARVESTSVQSLVDAMVDGGGGFIRRDVAYEEIDHNGRNLH